jgi:hypothetical protein
MVSTRRPSQAEQVASNARLLADGGSIFADAPNAVTSAAVTLHPISMHRNITPLRVTRSSRASSRASGGSTTIARRTSSPARSFTLLTRIRWINRCRGRPERCLQTGKRCFTNRERCLARWQATRSDLGVKRPPPSRSTPRSAAASRHCARTACAVRSKSSGRTDSAGARHRAPRDSRAPSG